LRISILGTPYGAHNIGDEAILEGITGFLKEDSLDLAAGVFEHYTCNRLGISDLPFIWCHRPRLGMWWRPLKKPLLGLCNRKNVNRLVSESDVLVVGGGTILSDMPWHALRYVLLAKAMGKPVSIFGAGICPIKDRETRRFVVKGVSAADAVWVRDEIVKERLVSYGVSREHVRVGGDPAFAVDIVSWGAIAGTLSPDLIRFLSEGPVIAVCFSGETDVIDKYPLDSLTRSIEILIEAGFKILYLPTNTRPGMDIELGERIGQLLPPDLKESYFLIRSELTPQHVVSVGSRISAVFSSRLHLLILMSLSGVPGLALSRNEKLLDLATIFELPSLPSVSEIDPIAIHNFINLLTTDANIKKRVILEAKKRRSTVVAAGKELKEWILSKAEINTKKASLKI
jgi:polysaccharide pyruvyl transferase WcaK-like protein